MKKISELAAHPDKPSLPDQQGLMNNELGVDQEGEFGRASEAVPELTSNDPKTVLALLKLAFDYSLLRGRSVVVLHEPYTPLVNADVQTLLQVKSGVKHISWLYFNPGDDAVLVDDKKITSDEKKELKSVGLFVISYQDLNLVPENPSQVRREDNKTRLKKIRDQQKPGDLSYLLNRRRK